MMTIHAYKYLYICTRDMTKVYVSLLSTYIIIIEITCPPIEPFANGTVAVSGLTIDSTATYKCNKGFILSGGYTVRVCGANHQWSGNTGVCKRTYNH